MWQVAFSPFKYPCSGQIEYVGDNVKYGSLKFSAIFLTTFAAACQL
jgi:hypothetical protein